jgi:hypothetical protein
MAAGFFPRAVAHLVAIGGDQDRPLRVRATQYRDRAHGDLGAFGSGAPGRD